MIFVDFLMTFDEFGDHGLAAAAAQPGHDLATRCSIILQTFSQFVILMVFDVFLLIFNDF